MSFVTPDFLLTKIIATVGPASQDESLLIRLIEEGVRVFRINFSHGNFEEYQKLITKIRRISLKMDVPIGLLGDLPGPKIRLGKIKQGGLVLDTGSYVAFQSGNVLGGSVKSNNNYVLTTNYKNFVNDILPGQKILIDDGNLVLRCIERADNKKNANLICKVLQGGEISSNKGINLPDTEINIPSLTKKDYTCIKFAVENKLEYLALSFVRNHKDVGNLRNYLERVKRKILKDGGMFDERDFKTFSESIIPIISKIEKPQAINDLEKIIQESDGIMVARGDLGVEMDLAEVALLQKKIISRCYDYGVPVIVATQMLQSMISSPSPTRAEVSDVANAILDGADAVMLSGETAVGSYPVESVRIMSRIAAKTNEYLVSKADMPTTPVILQQSKLLSPAIAHGVTTIVNDVDAKFIIVWSHFGRMAVYLSKHHLHKPILVFSNNGAILRRMSFLYGIKSLFMKKPKDGKEFSQNVDKIILKNKWAKKGEAVIILFGEPIDNPKVTNHLVVHFIGEPG